MNILQHEWERIAQDKALHPGAVADGESHPVGTADTGVATMTTKLSTIRQIAITVSDVEQALGFYRDMLGLTFLFRPGPDLAFLDAGGVRLMLSTPQGAGEVGKNSILYFTVSNIASVHAFLVERGATNERDPALAARMPDHELWTGFLRDPDGNLVGLMEEKK